MSVSTVPPPGLPRFVFAVSSTPLALRRVCGCLGAAMRGLLLMRGDQAPARGRRVIAISRAAARPDGGTESSGESIGGGRAGVVVRDHDRIGGVDVVNAHLIV